MALCVKRAKRVYNKHPSGIASLLKTLPRAHQALEVVGSGVPAVGKMSDEDGASATQTRTGAEQAKALDKVTDAVRGQMG